MFKKFLKGKPTLQELEAEYNKSQFHLGGLFYQLENIKKAITKCKQEMDNFTKLGKAAREKLQAEEVNNKIEEAFDAEGSNEVN